MASRMDDLQSRLARIQKEIDDEKARQAVTDALKRFAEKIASDLVTGAKEAKLDLKHLDGKVFRCQLDERTGDLSVELVAQTAHGSTPIAKTTVRSRT